MNLFIVTAVVGTGTDTVKEDIRLIERIYEKYGDFMYTAALEVLGKKHDAEDAVNDALCRMIKYLPKLKGRSDEVICSMTAICIRSIVAQQGDRQLQPPQAHFAPRGTAFILRRLRR